MLKHKYGLSMQAWIYRTKDLSIISENTAVRLFQQLRVNDWHRQEPGKPYPLRFSPSQLVLVRVLHPSFRS